MRSNQSTASKKPEPQLATTRTPVSLPARPSRRSRTRSDESRTAVMSDTGGGSSCDNRAVMDRRRQASLVLAALQTGDVIVNSAAVTFHVLSGDPARDALPAA